MFDPLVDEGGGACVMSLIDIPVGFHIYTTSIVSQGQHRPNDLFGQYGFVEDYPRHWILANGSFYLFCSSGMANLSEDASEWTHKRRAF